MQMIRQFELAYNDVVLTSKVEVLPDDKDQFSDKDG